MTPNASHGLLSFMTKRGDDGVKGPFARGVNIRVAGFHREKFAAILKHEAEARHDDAAAHAAIIALDEADHVAFVIGGAHVDGVAILQRRVAGHHALGGAIRIDQFATLGRVTF